MRNSDAATTIMGTLPLNATPSSPSRMSGTVSMITKKIEQRGELAQQCHDRIAASASEPGAHAAAAKLGPNCVAGGDRDNDVNHDRQQCAQQELGVVPLWVDQYDRFRDQRADT